MEHVVVPEPSRVRVPLCYFACHGTDFVGSCKMFNLLFLKPVIMERILSSELSFFILLMSRLLMRFPSSFCKDRVVAFLVRLPFFASLLMSSFCSNMITPPWCWMDKSEICLLNCTVVWICAFRHFSCVSKWTVVFPHRVLMGLVGHFYRCKIYLKTFYLPFLYCPALALKP